MRKQVATLLTVVFLVSLSISANAAVKPGSSCKKLGSISIYSDKKYTCVKSGKKLVWNKGKVVNKSISVPTQTLPIVPQSKSGLVAQYFDEYFAFKPDWFKTAKPKKTFVSSQKIGYVSQPQEVNYSIEWIGYFTPDLTGEWNFQIDTSDRATNFWFGKNAVVNFTSETSLVLVKAKPTPIFSQVTLSLKKGVSYPIRLQFGSAGNHGFISFKVADPSQKIYDDLSSLTKHFTNLRDTPFGFYTEYNQANQAQFALEKIASTPMPTSSPTPTFVPVPPEPKNLNDLLLHPESLSYWAWAKSSKQITSSSLIGPKATVILGPNTLLPTKFTQTAIDLVSRMYFDFTLPSSVITIFYNSQDITWAQQEWAKFSLDPQRYQVAKVCNVSDCLAGVAEIDLKGNGLMLMGINDPLKDGSLSFQENGAGVAHEFAHTIAMTQFIGTNKELKADCCIKAYLPWWMVEGNAEFTGAVTTFSSSYSNYFKERSRIVEELSKNSKNKFTKEWVQDYLDTRTTNEWNKPENSWRMYDIGFIINEIFVSIKGPAINMQLIKDVAKGLTWEQAFENNFGESWSTALSKLSDVVHKNLTLSPSLIVNKTISQSELKSKDYVERAKKSYEYWREHLPTQKASNLDIKYFYTENFPSYFLARFKSEAESTANFYSQFIDTNQIFNIYFLTEKDESYMDQFGLWDNPENRPTQFTAWRLGQRLNSCEGAAAWFTNSKNETFPSLQGGIAIASGAISTNFFLSCLRTVSHEMFHAIQYYWLTNKKGLKYGFASNREYDLVVMPIFREGSAEYVSGMVATTSFSEYQNSFLARNRELAKTMSAYIDFNSQESIVAYLKTIEFKDNVKTAHEDSYLLGNLFFEYLVSEHGFDKFTALLKSHNRETPFRDVFLKVYGFSIDQGYADASTHILNGLTYLVN